jgi:two-component system response regulator QseB
MRLLLVEDDRMLGAGVERGLRRAGHAVDWVQDGEAAEGALATEPYDVVLLDLGLPRKGGLEILRGLRHRGGRVPVLVLTAHDSVGDRVAGLDAGADDYLVKPFAVEELSARIRALGRRARGGAGSRLAAGPIVLDETGHVVYVDGLRIELSPREFSLLECLLRHRGQVLTRAQLLDHAWPYDADVVPAIVDTYVYFLRRKLGSTAGACIETVRGVGYRVDL